MFNINNKSGTVVAGLVIQNGHFRSGAQYVFKVSRQGAVIAQDLAAAELKRFKDVVHEVRAYRSCSYYALFGDVPRGETMIKKYYLVVSRWQMATNVASA